MMMLSRLATIPKRDRRTDGQTQRQNYQYRAAKLLC